MSRRAKKAWESVGIAIIVMLIVIACIGALVLPIFIGDMLWHDWGAVIGGVLAFLAIIWVGSYFDE